MVERTILVIVRPDAYEGLTGAFHFLLSTGEIKTRDRRLIKGLEKKLEGLGELKRGVFRQMSLTTKEAALLRDVVVSYGLPIKVPDK